MKLARPYTAWFALTLAVLFPLPSPAQDENWAATINHLRDLYHQHKYEEAPPLAGKPPRPISTTASLPPWKPEIST